MRALRIVGGAMALVACLAVSAHAQDTAEVKRLTILTFSSPVQVPGMTLPAGKYRFEIADLSGGAPHAVRVLSEDGRKLYTTLMTIPATILTRDLSDQSTVVMFAERPAGSPQAAKEWYYPGRSIGEEFVYPKNQAIQIAKANHMSVASSDDRKGGTIGRVDEKGNVTASEPEPARNQVAEVQAPAESAPAATAEAPAAKAVGTAGQTTTRTPRTLPRTASELSLFELLSGLSIAAGLSLRRFRKHAAARG